MHFTSIINVIFALAAVTTADIWDLGPQLSEVQGFMSSRFVECNSFIHTCNPGKASCADYICAQCTGLGQTRLNRCCATESAPELCLTTALLLQPNSVPATTTSSDGDGPVESGTADGNRTEGEGESESSAVGGIDRIATWAGISFSSIVLALALFL